MSLLDPRDSRALKLGLIFRFGTAPIAALFGVINAAIIIAATGAPIFGVVSLLSTIAMQIPFADLGIGAVVTTAVAQYRTGQLSRNDLVKTIARAYQTLATVAISITAVATVLTGVHAWGSLLGVDLNEHDDQVVMLVVVAFAVGVPASLGGRILTGLGRNELVVAANFLSSVLILGITLALRALGATGLIYGLSSTLAPTLVALIASALAWSMLRASWKLDSEPDAPSVAARGRLLAGAFWLLVISVGLPVGLQSGRYFVSHSMSPAALAEYALAAQLYVALWAIALTAGAALWPAFVRARGDQVLSMKLWRRSLIGLSVLGAALATPLFVLGSWAGRVITSGEIDLSIELLSGFAVLVLVQAAHLASGSMLTFPSELRWQAYCVISMAIVSLLVTWLLIGSIGVSAAAWGPAVAVFACQLVPDLLMTGRLVRRRSQGAPSGS